MSGDFVGGGIHDDLASQVAHLVSAALRVEAPHDRHHDRSPAAGAVDDRAEDLLGGVRARLRQQEIADRRVRRGRDALVEPLPADRHEARKQPGLLDAVHRGEELLARDEHLGDRVGDPLRASVADLVEVDRLGGADDALVLHPERDRFLAEMELRVLAERRLELLVGQLDAVAVELREADRQVGSVQQRPDLDRRPRVLALGNRLVAGQEAERHAVHLGVLGREVAAGFVDRVAAPSQPAPDDLLAQQLAAERADAEHMGDRVGVPALGEHRDGHDAADVLAELARLADRVHRLAQEVAVGELVGVGTGVAREVRLLEGGDLERGVLLELAGERVAGLDLRRVDEQRPLAAGPCPVDDVAEERQVAGHELPRAVGLLELAARDPVEHELGHGGVRAHDDHHRRRLAEVRRAPVS